jgi:hypothetical protein
MSAQTLRADPARPLGSLYQVRIWQLALVVLYVALAIVDIQDHRPAESFLVGLAAAGYAGYGLLCWLVWHGLLRWADKLGHALRVTIFAVSMGAVFLAAVIAYLLIEYVYLGGRLL